MHEPFRRAVEVKAGRGARFTRRAFRPSIVLALLVFASSAAAQTPKTLEPAKVDVMAWPRMTPGKFGCLLEKSFGFKDKKYSCAAAKRKSKEKEEGSAGPSFPKTKVTAVHPALKAIDLSWEHGELQNVSFELNGQFSAEDVRRIFKLPVKDNYPQPNVMSISIESCSKTTTCLSLQGFDHQGAGD